MAVFRADAKWTVKENGILFSAKNGYGRQRARSSTGMLLFRTDRFSLTRGGGHTRPGSSFLSPPLLLFAFCQKLIFSSEIETARQHGAMEGRVVRYVKYTISPRTPRPSIVFMVFHIVFLYDLRQPSARRQPARDRDRV